MAESVSWARPKLLGALQVLVGVACLGFGGVASVNSPRSLTLWTLSVASGYPFWSGLTFVTSGCLSVAADYVAKPIVVKSSLGANVVSALFAGVGTIVSVVELAGNRMYPFSSARLLKASNGLAGMTLFLSILELFIAILLSYQGRQAARHLRQPGVAGSGGDSRLCPAAAPAVPSAPPAYCNGGYAP